MKKFFMSFVTIIALSQNIFADYEVYTNKSYNFEDYQISSKEVIFSGKLKDYQKSLNEIKNSMIANGASGMLSGLSNQSANLAKGLLQEGLKAGVSGLGIGLVMGALNAHVKEKRANQLYVQVYKVKLNNGKTAYMNKFLVSDKHPVLSDKEIKTILGDK